MGIMDDLEPYALGIRTLRCFGHGCYGECMTLEHYRLGIFGHGCSSDHTHFKHERDYGMGMDALATVYRNTNGTMLWA